jgi:hypothetical protein
VEAIMDLERSWRGSGGGEKNFGIFKTLLSFKLIIKLNSVSL